MLFKITSSICLAPKHHGLCRSLTANTLVGYTFLFKRYTARTCTGLFLNRVLALLAAAPHRTDKAVAVFAHYINHLISRLAVVGTLNAVFKRLFIESVVYLPQLLLNSLHYTVQLGQPFFHGCDV